MRRFLSGIDTISEWSGKALSMLILVVIGILLLEVTLRYLFNAPTIWVHETSMQMFGSYSVLAGAYVLLHRRHIRIDVIYNYFPPRMKAATDSVTSLMLFLCIGLLLVYGWQVAWHSVVIREFSFSAWAPPVYYFRLTIPLGALLLLLQGLANFIRSLSMAIRQKELA